MNQIALLLQTVGFFTSVVLVAVIKWDVIKPSADKLKSIIGETPQKLKRAQSKVLMQPIVKYIVREMLHPRESKDESRKSLTVQLKEITLDLKDSFVFFSILLLGSLLTLLLSLLSITARLLSGHDVVTNILLGCGITAIFAGLLIELIISL